MPLLTGISILYQCRAEGAQAEVHPIAEAALAWDDDRITWVGPESRIPDEFRELETVDAGGRIVVPGLIDCHTHLAFGGWRAEEFEQRILGRTYLEIAEGGGGIASTVAQTRATSTEELVARCQGHLAAMLELGVTAVEAKSGYGLSIEEEIRLLEVYSRVAELVPQRLVPTFLGAHTIPPAYRGLREEYIRLVIDEMIPRIAPRGLARFCDVFVEESAFTVDEARTILLAGKRQGLWPKLHADQLSSSGGAELAAQVGATSADHLEHASDRGLELMASAGVVAVTLPFASIYLAQRPVDGRRLIDAGLAVAVATDFNPGSAPSYHLPMALTLGCVLQRMTPREALKGATIFAARAANLENEAGSIEAGKRADFVLIDADSVEQWLYHLRANAASGVWVRGRRSDPPNARSTVPPPLVPVPELDSR
jgi:imidazolonepropionase